MQQKYRNNELIGKVIEDKQVDSTVISVNIPSLYMNIGDDEFAMSVTENTIKTKDVNGNISTAKTNTTNVITATWYGASNEPYPPMVVKGEQVRLIWSVSDNKYYWEALGRDRHKRITDKKRIEVSAGDDPDKKDDNTYYIEIDSHTKKNIVINMSNSNGEVTSYKLEMNGIKGFFIITDSVDGVGDDASNNRIFMNSTTHTVQINNAKNSSFIMDGKDISCKCDGAMYIDAGEQIVMNSPSITLNEETANNIVVFNSQNLTVNSEQSAIMNSKNVGINAKTKITDTLSTKDVAYESLQYDKQSPAHLGGGIDISDGQHINGQIHDNDPINPSLNDGSVAFSKLSEILRDMIEAINKLNSKEGLPQFTKADGKIPKMLLTQLFGLKV